MKKMSFILGSLVSLAVVNTTLYAANAPKTCPNEAVIIKNSVQYVERDEEEGGFEVGQIHSYGTQHTWGFVIMVPFYMAKDKNEALQKAKQALPSLKANFTTPIYSDGMYLCLYNAGDLQAGAVTPLPLGNAAKSMQFR